ncbi:MAG: hypothetical protein VB035_10005 [Candidatus Fimivivens sp.]|nr:hypothetical protein [Candidatus Fimivivens sp.]
MSEELPAKVSNIDILRVEYGRRKTCQCLDPHYEIDYQNRLVYCTDCGAIVEPFEVLHNIAKYYSRMNEQVENLLEQRRKIASYKPHLVVIKELESHYRSGKMVPRCPHCGEPFDLKDLNHWCDRMFLKPKQQ